MVTLIQTWSCPHFVMIEWNEKMRSVWYSLHILFTVFRQIYVWNEGINTNDVNITEMNFKQVRGRDPRNILVGLLNLNNLDGRLPLLGPRSLVNNLRLNICLRRTNQRWDLVWEILKYWNNVQTFGKNLNSVQTQNLSEAIPCVTFWTCYVMLYTCYMNCNGLLRYSQWISACTLEPENEKKLG